MVLGWVSDNPNITWDIIKNNQDHTWQFYRLSWNKFEKDRYVQQKMNKNNAKIYLQSYIYQDIVDLIIEYI